MIGRDKIDEEIRQALLDAMQLSKTNLQIAEEYLDMDFQEEPELLKKVESQDFKFAHFGGRVSYLEWLQKKKRKEELGRYVRFIVEVGGSTAWRMLVGPYIGQATGTDLNRLLLLHTGEHASEQKIAVLAGAFVAFLSTSSCDAKLLCQSEKENPEIFLRAMDYCHECDGYGAAGKRSNAKLLLAAMYLHHMPVGTALETVEYLRESLIAAIEDIMAFEPQELERIQNFARTAEKDTPFPQQILSIFSERKGSENPVVLAGCAFLAIRHSVCFEIILRILVAVDYRYQGRDKVLNVCKDITEEAWFQDRMEEIEEMLPIQDDRYVRWSLKAGCEATVARMAVKRPEIIQAVATMIESEGYEKLIGIIQNSNYVLYEEMKTTYKESLRNKIVSELLVRCYTGRVEAKKYLAGECSVETLELYVEEWGNDVYPEKERYRKIEHLKEIGEISVYRRVLVLEILKKETGYFEVYRVYTGQNGSGQAIEEICADNTGNNALLYHRNQMKGMLQILEEEGVPIWMQTNALGGFCENIGDKKKKTMLLEQCVDIFAESLQKRQSAGKLERGQAAGELEKRQAAEKLEGRQSAGNLQGQYFAEKLQGQQNAEQWEVGMEEAVRRGNAAARVFCFMVFKRLGAGQYRDVYLSCAEDSTKQVRKLLLEICKEHKEWEAEILVLLQSKKLKVREFAVLVLEEWGEVSCLEKVKSALEREKNKKLAKLLRELVEELEAERSEKQEAKITEGQEAKRTEEQEAERTEGQKHERAEGQEAKGTEGQEAESAEGKKEKETEEGTHERSSLKRAEERLAVRIYRGARKRKVEWVQGLALPEVHRQDGELVSQEYMLAMLAAYADMDEAGINQDAVKLAAPLNPKEISMYMQSLYEEWKQLGAEAKKRWVLYPVAIHGGAIMVSVLYAQIKEWAEHSRGVIAAEAVRALAFNGSSEALVLVDQMSRKFKFRQIKNAAGEAISDAASALGIEREELEDRLVPDMGFDEQMERTFDYGSRKFTVRLNPALEMEVYDGNGKRLKSLPSPGKQDDSDKAEQAAEAFKQMKKQLKVVVQTQKLRLEQALSMARFWKIQDWRELFVKNPIMHQFAMGLIWGVYENGILKETFRYMEDGSFNTAEEEEYFLPEYVEFEPLGQKSAGQKIAGPISESLYRIGLVHPLELSKEDLLAWQNQLADYEVIQPFHQINRPVYVTEEEEEERFELERFHGKMLNGLSLSGKLLGMGWYRGEIMDGGFFDSYYHNDGNIGAKLTFSGSSMGDENEEVTVYNIYLYKLSDTEPKLLPPYLFSEEHKCKMKDVNPRYFSEIILQIAKATQNTLHQNGM